MSMPNIPDVKPEISVTRDEAVNIILSSIGMEELSLAHMLNAEAEKIQFALGTLESSTKCPQSMENILEVNKSSARVLRDIIKNQMLLSMKLEDVMELIPQNQPPHPPCPSSPPCPPHKPNQPHHQNPQPPYACSPTACQNCDGYNYEKR